MTWYKIDRLKELIEKDLEEVQGEKPKEHSAKAEKPIREKDIRPVKKK